MIKLPYLCLLLFALEAASQTTIYPYSDGHYWGLTNANGEVIAAPQFDTTVFFNRKSYAVAVKNKKYGTIGPDGKVRIGFTYDMITQISNNFGQGYANGKYMLLNLETSKVVSSEHFDTIHEACSCREDLFIASKDGKKAIISGITGERLGNATYEQARFFYQDTVIRVLVKTGGKYGLINIRTGAWLLPAAYDRIALTYHRSGQVIEVTSGEKVTYLDDNAKPIKEDGANPAGDGAEGLVAPADEKDLYVYNLGNNNWKLSVESRGFSNTQVFQTFEVKGYTAVEKLAYKEWDHTEPAIIKAVKNGKAGLIGLSGNVLLPFEYNNITTLSGEFIYVTTGDNKVGVLTRSLRELKGPVLKRVLAEEYRLQALLVEMPGGQQGYMDEQTGKIYIPGIEE